MMTTTNLFITVANCLRQRMEILHVRNLKYVIAILILFQTLLTSATTYYLSPSGNDTYGKGTSGSPWFTLNKAWTVVAAGDTIFMRGGTYKYNVWQNLKSKSGTAGNYIHVFAYPGEKPVITRGASFGNYSMIYVSSSNYIYFKGLEISYIENQLGEYPLSAFFFMDCNYCIWEDINYHHNAMSAIIRGNSTGNLILNCDFHHTYDPYRSGDPYGGADGLNIDYNSNVNTTNTVRGCRFWNNSDDGIDIWENDGNVIIENCWSWANGYREDGITAAGDGCGFKLGANPNLDNSSFKRTIKNCLAFNNRLLGITTNSCPAKMYIYNNTSYNNSTGFYHSISWSDAASIIRNNIAYNNSQINFNIKLPSATIDYNSWQGGLTVNSSDFVSLDTTGVSGARQPDGSLPNLNFLKIREGSDLINSGTNVGIPFSGSAPDLGAFEYSGLTADGEKPLVNSFSLPVFSTSLVVAVSSFNASDNKAVTGFKLTETSTAPLAGDAGWMASAPISYSFATEGTKTLYAWAKDAAGNVSASLSGQVVITLPDVTKPVVNAFSIPSASASLVVAVSSFTASDNKAVTGFKLTETSTAPLAGDAGWMASAPVSYSFATEGTKTLYAWAKDAAGNVSANLSGQVVITLPDVTKPVVNAFSIPSASASLVVAVSSFTASDNKAVTGFKLTETSTAPLAGDAGWLASAPVSYSFATEGTKTLYAWAKDAAGNVSASLSVQVVITLPDVTKPVVNAFSIPSASASLVVAVSSFTASDNKAVTGFKLTETSTAPLAGDAGWLASNPVSYTFATEGTKTLYAWAKDAAGNVSASLSGHVVITLPDVTKPVVNAFSIPSTSTSLVVAVSSFTASDNKAVTGFKLTETSTAPLAGDAGWLPSAPVSYTFASEGTKTIYAWVKDAAGNVSASLSGQVVITFPDITKPVVNTFSIPSTSTSLVVAVSSFTASDNKAVTGFKLTETSTAPLAGDAGWLASAPVSYTFATEGTKTLYAWAKDAAGNVSTSLSGQVIITLTFETNREEQILPQSISLRKGWNILSSYLTPTDENMAAVMEALRVEGKLIQVQDESGNSYEQVNTQTGWINNIGNVQKTEGYKIRVSSNCSLEITGSEIQLPLSIDIKKGWNLISFPINGTINAMQIIQPLIDSGVLYKVQDERGNSIELWKNRGWINGIGNFSAGEGYILQANMNGTLVIDDLAGLKSGVLYAERDETSYFKVCYDGNGFEHMNINFNELNKTNLQIGDEIAAFDGQICVGAIKLTEKDFENGVASIPVSASDQNEYIGFTDGNPIELKVWKNGTNEELNLNVEITAGEMVFNRQSSVFVYINDNQVVSGISDFDLLNISVYPNPASSVVNISYSSLPEKGTKITLMDINGREITSREVQNITETLDIGHLPSGLYMVKNRLNNNSRVQKLIKK